MPKATKLPSGSWRCRVYSHTDSTGKKVYESFTASTRQEAEMQAAKFANDVERNRAQDLTVEEAVKAYIASNNNVLSPSTIRGYMMDAKRLEPLNHLRIRKLTSKDIQSFVSDMTQKYAPKTIKNTYTLLITSIGFCGVESKFKVNLPTIPKKPKFAPENEQIVALYETANPLMKKVIILAAFHSLRRGEICGLKYGDLKGNKLHVHTDVVKGPNGWEHKQFPKTHTSNRTLKLTNEEVKILGSGAPDEYIVPVKPDKLDERFQTLRKKVGLDNLILHNLRSYFSSVAVAIGIPDIYAAHMTGHRENSTVLKEHYQKRIASIDEAYKDQMNEYFENLIKKV